jgi:hypothetical protein
VNVAERPTNLPRDEELRGSSALAASASMVVLDRPGTRSGTRVGCHEIAIGPNVRHVFSQASYRSKTQVATDILYYKFYIRIRDNVTLHGFWMPLEYFHAAKFFF